MYAYIYIYICVYIRETNNTHGHKNTAGEAGAAAARVARAEEGRRHLAGLLQNNEYVLIRSNNSKEQ